MSMGTANIMALHFKYHNTPAEIIDFSKHGTPKMTILGPKLVKLGLAARSQRHRESL